MRPATQRQRILAALERAGRRGVDRTEFLAPNPIDGGKPILQFAARIDELRQAGHVIEHAGRRRHCVIYRLVKPPPAPALPPAVDQPELFDRAVGAGPPASAIGDWEAEP